MNKYKILLLPGDGVGPEIMKEAVKVIDTLNSIDKSHISYSYADIGGIAIDNSGVPFPENTSIQCRDSDAILLGAVGTKKHDKNENTLKPETGLLQLRKSLDLFINIRPIFIFDSLIHSSSLKSDLLDNLDIVIVRELVGDVYFGEPRGFTGSENKIGFNTMKYSMDEVNRIADYAFKLAQKRKNKITSVDKANVLEASQVWRETVSELHKNNYENVDLSHMYVDNAAMQLVKDPRQFDIILTGNLFGDILSDEASMLTGSIGMLPSASLSDNNAVYEPIHGSAPDIANKGVVNPIAMILSLGMMFEYSFNNKDISSLIKKSIGNVLKAGIYTQDISDSENFVSTSDMGDAIIKEIKQNV